jgi:cation:H+ antiporter
MTGDFHHGLLVSTNSVDLLQLLFGGVMLYFGAEWLVSGSSRLATSLRVPQLIVGLTVVAYGTSAPEVIVGIQAAAGGHGDVALGNVIGSNITNIGLILGLTMLVRPPRVDGTLRRRELPVLAASTLALPLVLWDGKLQRWEALVLLALAVVYTALMVRTARQAAVAEEALQGGLATAEAAELSAGPPAGGRVREGVVALVGLICLLVGGRLFIGGATSLAQTWGMSERVVGLTIVAVGTSLPELATSLIAAVRGHSDIAVGNVVGSNIFNVLGCLGSSGLAGTITARPAQLLSDLATLLVMTALVLVFLRTARTGRRWEGAVLVTCYVASVVRLMV